MSRFDHEYLEARAEAELELAQEAEHPKAVKAHYELAARYLDRLHGSASDDAGREAKDADA